MLNWDLDHWHILSAFSGLMAFFIGVVFGLIKVMIAQFESRLDERFRSQETARQEAQKVWTAKFTTLEQCAQDESREWQRIERDILTLKADLPLNYVRREDYIRNQTIIEAKLDGLALKIENALLKNGG